MDEKKIIQALECCANGHCACCPYFRYINGTCREQLASDGLELVKKQREEINELTGKHYNKCGQIARYSDELNQFAGTDKKVEPVKHGRNISCMNPVDGFLCSECRIKIEGYYKVVYDEDAEDYNHYEYEMKYCPNCGAKITGGEDNA